MNGDFKSLLSLPEQDRRDVFEATASRLDTLPGYVEKDFWVCLVLGVVFNRLPKGHPRLIFKGGTSLSKAFGLIARFSEDIDLVVSRDDLGFENDRDPTVASHLSNRKRAALFDELRSACNGYIHGDLRVALTKQIDEIVEGCQVGSDEGDVEDYITSTYTQASATERTAVGFVMTIYRRRLASSFSALHKTLQNHLDAITAGGFVTWTGLDEDATDDETTDEILDADEVGELERAALAAAETADIQGLLYRIGQLPPDSKLESLKSALHELHQDGYRQAMVFTQYTDTMDFLREELLKGAYERLLCFSGRGGEILSADGSWRRIGRDDAKRRFRDGEADILLCTDAAAEGLNFQFCGAVINYDMPWNPMRVEQRIGRIDRLGQQHETIRIVNLHYNDTVETDVYRALRSRIGLFKTVVGSLQPILAQLPRMISQTVLSGENRDARKRANVMDAIEQKAREAERRGFNIDAVTERDLVMPRQVPSSVTMEDLDRIIGSPDMMPPGTDVQPMGHREYGLLAPGMKERLRVTTDPEYFEEHAESMELWSPGNPLFTPPEFTTRLDEPSAGKTLKDILDS